MHNEERWLSKTNILVRLAETLHMVLVFVQGMKSQACSEKIKDKAETLFQRLIRIRASQTFLLCHLILKNKFWCKPNMCRLILC